MRESEQNVEFLAARKRTLVVTLAFFLPALPLGATMLVREMQLPAPIPRCRGYHGYATGSMRAYASAQSMYRRNDWDGDTELEYATPFTRLSTELDGAGNPIQLIDAALAAATGGAEGGAKHGYVFRDMKTIGGKPIDWSKEYAFCAIPAVYGRTGYCTLIVTTDGTVWCKDRGEDGSPGFVNDFPRDPAKAGWTLSE
jgi:hypothetical protein